MNQRFALAFAGAYDRRILRESMRLADKHQGFHDGRASEIGYVFDSGRMTPISRSEFEQISATHYLVHDFEAGTASGSGAATDTEDCSKVK